MFNIGSVMAQQIGPIPEDPFPIGRMSVLHPDRLFSRSQSTDK